MFYWFVCFFLFFKQKTAYEMRISDWSSDVCSSDLIAALLAWSLRYVTVFADDILAARRELDRLEARRDRLVAADAGLPDADRRQRRRTRLKASFGRRRREGHGAPNWGQIGRASWRARVCPYGYVSVVAGSLKKTHRGEIQ